MKLKDFNGYPKQVSVTCFNASKGHEASVRFSLTAEWPEDVIEGIQKKLSQRSYEHFMAVTGGQYQFKLDAGNRITAPENNPYRACAPAA